MHMERFEAPAPSHDDSTPWYKTLTRYHWFVLMVAGASVGCLIASINSFSFWRDRRR